MRICASPAKARARASDGGSAGIESLRRPIGIVGELALPGDPRVSAQPLMEQGTADRVVLVHQPDRGLDVRDGARRVLEAGDACQPRQQVDPITTRARRSVRHLVPELDRPLVLRHRLRERIAVLGDRARGDGRLERPWQVVRRVPVIRQLGGMVGFCSLVRFEGPRERGMEAHPLARQQVVVNGLLQQRVAEGIPLAARGGIGDQHLARHGLAERTVQRSRVHVRCRCQQSRIDTLTGGRCDAQELLSGLRQLGDARQQYLSERLWQLRPIRPAGSREQLLGIERVAPRAHLDRLQEVRIQWMARDGRQLRCRLLPVEGAELEPLDASGAFELGEERQQWVPPVELIRPVREQEHHRRVPDVADQESEQIACRPVGPVEVVDDEQHGGRRSQPIEQSQQQLEQPTLGGPDAQARRWDSATGPRSGTSRASSGSTLPQEVGQLGFRGATDQAPERFDQWRVRQGTIAHHDATTQEHEDALGAGLVRELGHQPRLAHPSFSANERCAAGATRGTGKGIPEPGVLAHSPDEDGARDTGRHAPVIGRVLASCKGGRTASGQAPAICVHGRSCQLGRSPCPSEHDPPAYHRLAPAPVPRRCDLPGCCPSGDACHPFLLRLPEPLVDRVPGDYPRCVVMHLVPRALRRRSSGVMTASGRYARHGIVRTRYPRRPRLFISTRDTRHPTRGPATEGLGRPS